MAIEIIESPRRLRSFLAYDLEWVPGTMRVRVVGVYDGREYRSYFSVAAFLDGELVHKNRGKWFYAHAGGLADIQFILAELQRRPEFEVSGSFSGSSLIIAKIKRGHNVWTFVDSYWLLRAKLADVAKWIGMEKGGPEEGDEQAIQEWYARVPLKELIEYNRNDCEILWNAVAAFQERMLEFGGELMITLAASAMRLFRRRYLSRTIDTSRMVNQAAVEAYIASRIEVFFRGLIRRANYYDINSSFPYAMTFPQPAECVGIGSRIPDDCNRLYIAKLDVEVPERYFTSTPVRIKERVYFPTGRFSARLCSVDVQELIKDGGRILKVHEVMHFRPFHDLGDYARDLYAKRQKCDDALDRETYKLLLNGLYGKFAEMVEKLKLSINPSYEALERLSFEDQISPGVFLQSVLARVNHRHVPIAVFITAIARRTVDQYLRKAGEGHFHYVDTDGFSTTKTFKTGKGLGQLKLEDKIRPWERKGPWQHVAPKLYRHGCKVKAKGFSLGWDKENKARQKEAIRKFNDLIEGKEIKVERMIRLRENLRQGLLDPRETIITKRLSENAIPKRYTYRDGTTRPWSMEELKGILHV